MSDESWINRLIIIFVLFLISSAAYYLGTEGSDADNDAETSDTAEPVNTPQIVSIGTWGPMDLFDPETALGHGIPGCIKVKYETEPTKITFVIPGKEVRYEVTLELKPYRDDFTETLVVLEPWNSRPYAATSGATMPPSPSRSRGSSSPAPAS
jgi:hypothetical protein